MPHLSLVDMEPLETRNPNPKPAKTKQTDKLLQVKDRSHMFGDDQKTNNIDLQKHKISLSYNLEIYMLKSKIFEY